MNINQAGWTNANIVGHSIDPHTGKVDKTEGFGSYDAIRRAGYNLGMRNFDCGGGSEDYNSAYLEKVGGILKNYVYDPFMRVAFHNIRVLSEIEIRKADTATSMSVLNVIDNHQARLIHIRQMKNSIKDNGKAFFIVWPGNRSGVPSNSENNYQANAPISRFADEIKSVFGRKNVKIHKKLNLAVAKKREIT